MQRNKRQLSIAVPTSPRSNSSPTHHPASPSPDPSSHPAPDHGPARPPRLTYLLISHDLGFVEHLFDRVVIMYLGRIIESAPTGDIFARANPPYTQALLAEVPRITSGKRRFTVVKGEIPSSLDPPSGCHFHPRCPHAMPRCVQEIPTLKTVAPVHNSACHLNDSA